MAPSRHLAQALEEPEEQGIAPGTHDIRVVDLA
jgi:hypothetical protein